MCGPSYVFLFDTIYDRVKRLTKRMTSRRGPLVGRVSRGFTALREWITVASARATEADQSARGTYWNWSRTGDDLRGKWTHGRISPSRLSGRSQIDANEFVGIARRCHQIDVFTLSLIHATLGYPELPVADLASTICTRSIGNDSKTWEKKSTNFNL